jgi:hypothetical protein
MKYYKQVENGIITMIGSGPSIGDWQTEITPAKYAELDDKFKNSPEDTFESIYYFDDATETYLPRERTEEEKVDWYVQIVQAGTVALEDIPEEYRAEVEKRLPVSEEEQWANEIMEEVSEYGY